MNRFRAAYINELYKLSKKKKITVAAILSVAAVCIGGLIVLGVNNFIGINVTGKSEFGVARPLLYADSSVYDVCLH